MSVGYLLQLENRCTIPVCIGRGKTFQQLLDSSVNKVSKRALKLGIKEGMKGCDVLTCMLYAD